MKTRHYDMRLFVTATLGFCLFTQAAVALSCMSPNLARSFNWAAESDDAFVVAYGKLSITDPVPKAQPGKSRTVSAVFSGDFLSSKNSSNVEKKSIEVMSTCASRWCGPIPTSDDLAVLFFKRASNRLVLESGPCPGAYYANPSAFEISTLKKCLKRGKCSDWQINRLEQR